MSQASAAKALIPQLIKVDLPPGLSWRGTLYQTTGRWYTSNLVRWFKGAMKPIGAWSARTTTPMTGKGRAIQTWLSNSNIRYIAVGTESHLYAFTPSLTAPVDITPAGFTTGHADSTSGGGYGVGLYGVGTYGTPRVDNVSIQDASQWTLDIFGQYLEGVMSDDGKLYEWQLDISTPTRAAAVSGAPTGNAACVVTPEAFVVCLGAGGDPRKAQWCDQGANTTWTPTATNQAGDFNIQSNGRFMAGRRTRRQTLLFTDLDAHVMQYVGLPYVYTIDRVGENCGIISRNAHVAIDNRVIWMGLTGFFMYDGSQAVPLDCEIYDAVFGNINFTQHAKVYASILSEFTEVWFFFPSSNSTEIDTAAVYNYEENTWMLHSLSRLAMVDRSIYHNPIMVSSDGYLYDHEIGTSWGAVPFAESGPAEIGDGEYSMKVTQAIFDDNTEGDVQVSFATRNWNVDAETTYGPYTDGNPVAVRFTARAVRQYVEFLGAGQWGAPRFRVQPGARRS